MRLEAAKTPGSHRWLVWISLLVTLGLVYWQWLPKQGEETLAVSEAAISRPQWTTAFSQDKLPPSESDYREVVAVKAASQQTETSLGWQRQLPTAKLRHPLFAAQAWLPPPPKPEPPPLPQAPPVPYTYVGSMQDVPDGHTIILMQQKKMLLPKLGGQINAQWRLDSEDAQSVYFTYLPLNQAVTLSKTKAVVNPRRSVAEFQPEDNLPLEQ